MYLSGQIDLDDNELRRRPKALSYIQKFREEGPVPWFPPGYSFLDFSGLEATHTSKIFSDAGERTNREVLAARGITLSALPQLVSAGETILRRLFQPLNDEQAGIWFKRRMDTVTCPILFRGLNGGLTRKKDPKTGRVLDEISKDHYFDHLHDCIRYIATGTLSPAELAKQAGTKPPKNRDEFIRSMQEEDVPDGYTRWVDLEDQEVDRAEMERYHRFGDRGVDWDEDDY